jgi:DNA-binding MarR family transcriptional regulator
MGEALKRRIRQVRFENSQQEALLNLIVASNYIRELLERAVGQHGITLPQYNVLRILRGVYPDGHPRCDIASRMLDRAPDVTRIIDRLEEKRFVERDRAGADRRHSIARITREGLRLLEEIEPTIRDAEQPLDRLSVRDCTELSRICELLYDETMGAA